MNIPDMPLAWLPLADAVAKTTVILLAASGRLVRAAPASAALRHLVWTLALSSALVLPIASFALPKWQLPLVTITSESPAPIAAGLPSEEPVKESSVASAFRRKDAAGVSLPPEARAAAAATTGTAPQAATRASIFEGIVLAADARRDLAARRDRDPGPHPGRARRGPVALDAARRKSPTRPGCRWRVTLARDMGVSDRLRFLRSGRASMPVATGIFRPAVIMPTDADTWSESRLRIVLLHELAHVKRRDCLTHVLGQAACAFHWFNPLAWLAVKRARTERERACDDLVLACGTRGSDYADQLLEMARVLRGDRFPALLGGASLAMAHRSQLEGRLIAILDPRVPRSGLTRGRAAGRGGPVLCRRRSARRAAAMDDATGACTDRRGAALVCAAWRCRLRPRSGAPGPAGARGRAAAGCRTPERDRVDDRDRANRHGDATESERAHHAADPHRRTPVPQPMPMPHPVVNEAIAVGDGRWLRRMAQAVARVE